MPRIEHRRVPANGRRGRSGPQRELRRRLLIVCEGVETEPNYFRAFPVPAQVEVRVKGEGRSTTSLVKAAEAHAEYARRSGDPFDEVWVVFDKDDFTDAQFNQAEAMVSGKRGQNWNAAWSNPCFELWFLLHFQDVEACLHQSVIVEKLERWLTGYHKGDRGMYRRLLPKQSDALRRAEALVRDHEVQPAARIEPARAGPCTMVHRLVASLNREL